MKKLITMFSTFAIVSSITPLTIACNKDSKLKGEPIDIEKITADMIINWKSEYKETDGLNEKQTVLANKLGSLSNPYIARLIKNNLFEMFRLKLNEIDKIKLNNIESDTGSILSDEEHVSFMTFLILKEYLVSIINVEDKNNKKFTVILAKSDWNKANENNKIKTEVEKCQEKLKQNPKLTERYEILKKQVNFDSVKSMHDLIKGNNAVTIEIDLTDKQ